MSTASLKSKAYEELFEKVNMLIFGVRVSDETAAATDAGITVKEGGTAAPGKAALPFVMRTPSGFNVIIKRVEKSEYALEYSEGKFIITKNGHQLFSDILFEPRPRYYNLNTTDGKPMREIGMLLTDGCVEVWYSNECAFKERNEECMFCGINTRPQDTFLKTSRQLAEVAKAAFDEGVARRVDFTGGVIAERREIEYYCDAIEAIRDALGGREIISSACVAAPRDFTNISRLKEAGFTNITINMEIWDENIFKTICPGKERTVGRDRWVEALSYASDVFGFGHIRCNFVTGIEPKHKTLEGIERLAAIGVVGNPNLFSPAPGTPLEGTRCPTPEWNMDLQQKAYAVMRKHGLTFEQVKTAHAETNGIHHDIWRIENEILPIFHNDSEESIEDHRWRNVIHV
jgi:hypothetical protein